MIDKPGFYPDLSCDAYFADPCPEPSANSTVIRALTELTPRHAHALHPKLGQRPDDRKSTAAQYKGSVVHRLALGKGSDFAISPYDEYRTNEAKAWRDTTTAKGVIPIKQKDYDAAVTMAEIAEAAIEEAVGGEEYETEVVVIWQEANGIWCRAMLDVWCPARKLIVDLKTCASASDDSVDRSMMGYGYARQGAWYKRGVETALHAPGEVQFLNLFVETGYPHCARTAQPSAGQMAGCEQEIERALAIWSECLRDNAWPGYGHRVTTPKPWDVQRWIAMGIDVDPE